MSNATKPTHTGDNGGAPTGNPTPNPSGVRNKDVRELKDWRTTATQQIGAIVGGTPLGMYATKDLTELTDELRGQNTVNLDINKRLALLEGLVFGLIVFSVCLAFILAGAIWYITTN